MDHVRWLPSLTFALFSASPPPGSACPPYLAVLIMYTSKPPKQPSPHYLYEALNKKKIFFLLSFPPKLLCHYFLELHLWNIISAAYFSYLHVNCTFGASLVAQWLRICLPMQGTRVRALVWEEPTCRWATRPVSHNYWACASGACAPQQERPQ